VFGHVAYSLPPTAYRLHVGCRLSAVGYVTFTLTGTT
jgi:hypothetical protein